MFVLPGCSCGIKIPIDHKKQPFMDVRISCVDPMGNSQVQQPYKLGSRVILQPKNSNSLGWTGHHMGVSKNRGAPKSSILIGFSIINHPFWGTPIFGNIHIFPSVLVASFLRTEPDPIAHCHFHLQLRTRLPSSWYAHERPWQRAVGSLGSFAILEKWCF